MQKRSYRLVKVLTEVSFKVKSYKKLWEIDITYKRENILDWLKTIVLALLITFVVKFFLLDLTRIDGRSMEDSLENDDIVLVDKISPRLGSDYGRGEVLLFDGHDEGKIYIKRIIAFLEKELTLRAVTFI